MKWMNWFAFLAILLALTLMFLVFYNYTSVFGSYVMPDREAWGQFGDYFGGILNPIFSFLAFIALLITLRLQIAASKDAFRRDLEQVREQRFFQLLAMVGKSATEGVYFSMYTPNNNERKAHTGHLAFHAAWCDFNEHRLKQAIRAEGDPMHRYGVLVKEYGIFQRTAWPTVSVFIESSFLILEFIAKNGTFSDGFFSLAMSTLRVQMTEAERLILWYAALCIPKYAIYISILKGYEFAQETNSGIGDSMTAQRNDMIMSAFLTANISTKK
jgi:uncharacterized membrane protein